VSDYISLEELQRFTDTALYERWQDAEFPFDNALCGQCATQHKYFGYMCAHEDFKQQARHLHSQPAQVRKTLRRDLAEIYALRMFFRDLYPSTPSPEPAEEETPAAAKTDLGHVLVSAR